MFIFKLCTHFQEPESSPGTYWPWRPSLPLNFLFFSYPDEQDVSRKLRLRLPVRKSTRHVAIARPFSERFPGAWLDLDCSESCHLLCLFRQEHAVLVCGQRSEKLIRLCVALGV